MTTPYEALKDAAKAMQDLYDLYCTRRANLIDWKLVRDKAEQYRAILSQGEPAEQACSNCDQPAECAAERRCLRGPAVVDDLVRRLRDEADKLWRGVGKFKGPTAGDMRARDLLIEAADALSHPPADAKDARLLQWCIDRAEAYLGDDGNNFAITNVPGRYYNFAEAVLAALPYARAALASNPEGEKK